MKIAVIVTRILLGLLLIMASVVYLFALVAPPEQTGAVKTFNEGMEASVYMMPLVKVIELLCGICFLVGRFVPLATVVIFPITVNIVLFHAFLDPQGLPVTLVLLVGNLFLAYVYRKNYQPLLAVK